MYEDEKDIIMNLSEKQLLFEKYSRAQMPLEEILLVLNLTPERAEATFNHTRKSVDDYYRALKAEGKAELLAAQYQKGISDKNTALLVHLGTYWADQTKDNAKTTPIIFVEDDSNDILEP